MPSEAIVSEGSSLNTLENIRNVRAMVGDGRVALVTSGYHMPRALKIARQGNLNVGAFPTDWPAGRGAAIMGELGAVDCRNGLVEHQHARAHCPDVGSSRRRDDQRLL